MTTCIACGAPFASHHRKDFDGWVWVCDECARVIDSEVEVRSKEVDRIRDNHLANGMTEEEVAAELLDMLALRACTTELTEFVERIATIKIADKMRTDIKMKRIYSARAAAATADDETGVEDPKPEEPAEPTEARTTERETIEGDRTHQQQETMDYVFISYVRENQHLVDRLCRDLEHHGLGVWLDRDQILPGERWRSAIRNAIRNGAHFLACFSQELLNKRRSHMNDELTFAIDELRQRHLNTSWFIPARLNDCEIPERDIGAGEVLTDLQRVDLFADWDDGVQRIIRAVTGQYEKSLPARHLFLGATHWTEPLMYIDHTGQRLIRAFEIDVHNSHREQPALNAIARLKQILNSTGPSHDDIDRSRLKAVGKQNYSQTIWPLDHEAWDLFSVSMDAAPLIFLNSELDVKPRRPAITASGNYVLTYEILAEHFPVLEFDVRLSVKDDPEATSAVLAESATKTSATSNGGSVYVNGNLRAGDGSLRAGGDVLVEGGPGGPGGSGGDVRMGPGEYRAGDGGPGGKGGELTIRGGQGGSSR